MTSRTPSPRDEQPDRGPEKPHLSVRQQALWEELAALDQVLAGLYLHGVRLLSEVDSPGVAHLIAHVGRELTLGVVEAVLEEGLSLTQRGRSEIPEDEAHRGKIARSLGLDPSHPRVSQWFDLHNSFVRATHHRRGNPAPDPDDIRLNFERLEKFLYGRVAPYFETQTELDDLLAVSEPDDNDLERLETLLLRPKQRSYFFEKLTHSGWIKSLDRRRMFGNPPERLVHPDGSWQAVSWPEGGFLARVAANEPKLVVQILDRLDTSIENPGVWRVVADVANRVSPDLGCRLAPKLAEAAENVLPVLFTDELLTLIRRLADAGHGESFDLATVLLFVPNADDLGNVSPYGTRSDWLLPRLWRTQFPEFVEEALPSLERANPNRTLDLLLDRLRQIAAVRRKLDLPRLLDARSRSNRHRPDPHDVAGGMIEASAAVLTRFGEETPEQAHRALEMLDQLDDAVFTRLRYRLVASAGHHLQEELDALVSSNVAIEPGDFGREIALVLREQYENASDGAREVFRYAIQRGPDPETVWNRLRWREIESPSAADVENVKRDWQQQRLTWFRGEIPNELRDLAERLGVWDKEPSLREQELAEVGFYSGPAVWSGEPAPFTADELSERSTEEIARLIVEWRPDERSYETGTIRGFQLSLQELATSNPAKALDIWKDTGGELSCGFAASVLDGLRDALRAETEGFAWDRTLSVVLEAIANTESSPEIKAPIRQSLLRSGTDLLEEGVTKDLIPVELEDRVWDALASIVENPVAWDEEEDAFESFGDLLTASLNRAGSRAIQATLQAGLWSYRLRQNNDVDDPNGIEERVAPILDVILERTGSGRVTAEAMIGQYLPQLQLVAPKWLGEHLNELLEKGATEPFDHPAWGAYVTRSHLYDSIFEMLRPWYLRAAQAADTAAGRKTSEEHDWSLTQNLAKHLMIAVLRGLASTGQSDRLVETVFENVPAEDRSHAYWIVFRGWSDVETAPPEPFVARLLTFWDWRLTQLEGFDDTEGAAAEAEGLGWFLRTPYLPDEELLRLGLRTARAANGRLELQTEWDRLIELAATDVDAVLQIAELVLRAQLAETPHYIAVDEVKPLLQVVLDRGGPEIESHARRLVHRLGEAGYDDFRELVE